MQLAGSDASVVLSLLGTLLTSAAEFSQALASRCPAAHQTITQLALYAGIKFLGLTDEDSPDRQLESLHQLIAVLQHHPDQAQWAAALLQVSVHQLSGVLPSVLGTKAEVTALMLTDLAMKAYQSEARPQTCVFTATCPTMT